MNTIESTVKYIRSKNAGPFWLTIDAFCNNVEDTERVAAAFENNRAKIAADFQVKSEDLQIYCLKNIFERDMHGGQQYVSLLDIPC